MFQHVLLVGAAYVAGPGPVARGPLEARWRDAPGMSALAGIGGDPVGAELRILAPVRELEVRDARGERFPHHASEPLLWTVALRAHPLPRLRRGIGERLRPFVALGGGGMLVTADLDNTTGSTLYHAWQWTLGAGLRLALGLDDPRAGRTLIEIRFERTRVAGAGPFFAVTVRSIGVAIGLAP